MDFSVVKRARLGPSDFCKLVDVSRATASVWLNGHKQPHHLLTARVEKVLDQIEAAVDSARLPVPHHIPRRERGLYIQNALAAHQ